MWHNIVWKNQKCGWINDMNFSFGTISKFKFPWLVSELAWSYFSIVCSILFTLWSEPSLCVYFYVPSRARCPSLSETQSFLFHGYIFWLAQAISRSISIVNPSIRKTAILICGRRRLGDGTYPSGLCSDRTERNTTLCIIILLVYYRKSIWHEP